jgi:hypothetical protein
MIEIGIFCVILFAVGYWATLFIMGRREDVLHGEFVEGEAELIPVPEAPPMPFPGMKPASHPTVVAAVEPSPVVASEPPPEVEPLPAPVAATMVPKPKHPVQKPRHVLIPPAPRPIIALPPANTERLQSLLVSIKQELKNASQT